MPFAQLVIGPPGSGKTTYCFGQYQFLSLLSRPCSVVNLDPANDRLPYPCAVDINKLISVRDVMSELSLGPNAAMLYCIEYLEKNVDWLIHELKRVIDDQRQGKTGQIAGSGDQQTPIGPVSPGFEYLVFDLPGQVELSTNHPSLKRILETLEKQLGLRFVAVHLTDATHITDASRYVSILILALRAMLSLELPHVNVLSKVDLLGQNYISRSKSTDRYDLHSDGDEDIESYKGSDEKMDDEPNSRAGMGLQSDLAFNLDFYTQVQDLSYLRDLLSQSAPGSSRRNEKYGKLNRAICELVEDFGLVSFETLAVEDKRSMFRLLQVLDKAVGYIYVSSSNRALEFGEEEEEGAYEPGRASATASAALRVQARPGGMGADPHALFSVADRGDPLGWGDALEVQERYIDHRELYEEVEMEERKQRHEKEWEDKVWSEVRKVAKEEQHKKNGSQAQP
ncbi:related to GPN-loop GTPase 2 homolog [Melanopsichium pennsylvanicum]|uniref:Related to GPN-loop GTPase 2 homolog n=2 Tax=Melanopsichium pennsylvanicum TaxID=63383 RepID=A0AAJ4XGA7_9BASI|nr:cytoplasmic protein [Melanopsichium pennsylvanicum 4]SNX81859.1 related to GPN-loop GTPase 2 homolog [Melanopsichium pennsylvanicum]